VRFRIPSPFSFLLVLALAGCRSGSPEARIQRAFAACVEGVEKGDAHAATAALSPSFLGPEGMGRDEAKFFLAGLLKREKVGVTVLAQKVEVHGGQALQTVDLMLTGRTGGALLPEERSSRTYLLRWELRDGAWLLRELRENPGS